MEQTKRTNFMVKYLQNLWLSDTAGLDNAYISQIKFGSNSAQPVGEADVWAGADLQADYVFPSRSGEAVTVVSDNVADDSTVSVKIIGLDANGDAQTETVALDGTDEVAVPGTWSSIHRAYTVGAVATQGRILVQAPGGAGNIYASYKADAQQTEQMPFMVPRGYTCAIVEISNSLNKPQGQDSSGIFMIYTEQVGGVKRRKLRYGLQSNGTSLSADVISMPNIIPELTRVYTAVDASAGPLDVTSELRYILVHNDALTQEYLDKLNED